MYVSKSVRKIREECAIDDDKNNENGEKLLRHTVILLLTASLKVHVDEVHVKCGGGGGDGARLMSVHVL